MRLADFNQAASRSRQFRSRAYRRAIWSLDDLSPELGDSPEEILAVSGIGPGIARLIEEFRGSGQLRALTALEARFPREAPALSRLPRMTPSRLEALKSDLAVETVEDLRSAIRRGEAQALPGVGPQTASYWMRTLDEQREGLPIYQAQAYARQLAAHIEKHRPGTKVTVAGAVCRLEEWIKEIELAVSSRNGLDEFLASSAAVASMPVKVTVTTSGPSEVRAGIITPDDVRGDLHCHTDWSPDGRQSLVALVKAALERGYEYVGITDHGVGLRFGGLDQDRLLAQRIEIEAVRAEYPAVAILHGAELNISRDGSVDYDQDLLAWLDFTVAGVHSFLGLGRDEQTARVLAAIANPEVDIIAHLTGRRIGIRPPIELDLPAVFAAAAEHGTILEVNGHLDRLDLSAALIRAAGNYGVNFVANSDAHRTAELTNVENAVVLLQTAGIKACAVINTWTGKALKKKL